MCSSCVWIPRFSHHVSLRASYIEPTSPRHSGLKKTEVFDHYPVENCAISSTHIVQGYQDRFYYIFCCIYIGMSQILSAKSLRVSSHTVGGSHLCCQPWHSLYDLSSGARYMPPKLKNMHVLHKLHAELQILISWNNAVSYYVWMTTVESYVYIIIRK